MNATTRIFLERLENRQFLSADFAGFAPPLEEQSAGAITIEDVDVGAALTGCWIGEIVDKGGLVATVQIDLKCQGDGCIEGEIGLTLYPRDEMMTFAVTGQFDADEKVLALEWNADKTCCGTLNGTFDLATGQLEAQIEYNMAGEQRGYSFMLSKMPLWENVAESEPRIMQAVEAIAGSLYGS